MHPFRARLRHRLSPTLPRVLLSALIGLAVPGVLFAESAKPNFLIIIGDDVGYDAFGCTGSKFARTPNIDKLASEGLVFDRFYGTVSQCAPIRAELYTGLFPVNNGKLANARSIAKEGVKSIVDHLKPLGYDVGLSGKGHFNKGGKFEKISGFPAGANSSVAAYDVAGLKGFIEKSQAGGRSFCAVIGSIHAHHPWDLGDQKRFDRASLQLPDHWVDTPGAREALARHAAEVEELDHQVGAAVGLLEAMKLSEDTVVVFLSEQGIAMPRAKWSVYDHGNRSLCIMRQPGTIEPRRTEALGQYCDIVPTFVDLAGGEDPGLDGFSLRPVIEGQSKRHREFVYLYNVHPTWQRAIIRDGWKLVWSPEVEREHIWSNFVSKSKFFSVPWAEWRALAKTRPAAAEKVQRIIHPKEYELYHIDEDFYETENLAASAEHEEKVESLAAELKAFMKKIGDPLYTPAAAGEKKPRKRKGKR